MIRVLGCGGRYYDNHVCVFSVLDAWHARYGIACVIEGGAGGADALCKAWAIVRGVDHEPYPANWKDLTVPGAVVRYDRHGRPYNAAAGHDRNQRMRDLGKPDVVLAWPGGTGTADMVALAREKNIFVWEPCRKA